MAVAEELGVEIDVVLYMKEPPDEALLGRIAAGLEDPVEALVRKDSQFKKLELDPDDYVGNAEAVVELLAQREPLRLGPVRHLRSTVVDLSWKCKAIRGNENPVHRCAAQCEHYTKVLCRITTGPPR